MGPRRLTRLSWTLAVAGSVLGLVAAGIEAAGFAGGLSGQPALFCLLFLAAGLAALLACGRHLRLAFLLGLLPLLIGWRVAALAGADLTAWLLLPAFIGFLLLFAGLAWQARAAGIGLAAIQLGFVRLYLGLDLVPHFTEKLFAGSAPRMEDVKAFAALGVPAPLAFVLLAGLVELAAAIGVGLGLMTRLAALGTVLYLMIATIMGNHFALGFIWAEAGGGWEYPVLWSVLILGFAATGGGFLSLDRIIAERFRLPGLLRHLAGGSPGGDHRR